MGALTPPDGQTADGLAAWLADQLRARGSITQLCWEQALREVPRHHFVPAAAWFSPNHADAPKGRFDVHTNPPAWWAAVYADTSIVTQTDDGAGDPASGKGTSSSSVSAPGIVFPFLELLNPQVGDHVLEIGTGSGWTAALLSWAIGPDGVTSIELDPQVAAQAEANLRAAGFSPHLVVGDGVKGSPERAPFDGVHVTAGVSQIPLAWIEQTRPGGTIVLPWHGAGPIGYQLRLTVLGDASAIGRFHERADYMMLREQRFNLRWSSHRHKQAVHSTTVVNPHIIGEADLGARLLCAALAPRVAWYDIIEDSEYSLLLYELDDHTSEGSWAACDHAPGAAECRVTQYGPRRLWDEVSAAYLEWLALGSPGYERFGLSIDPTGTRLWLDHPDGPAWDLPTQAR
ncbi:methyltransferase domain-containing protein [Acrocarpospora macrocephala]|uniref:Protein-L-isoaspartate O-methyltransferase n=1 Tax=Acrocarpospora macrocephala TaxID=150177 RepID=A0A5M3X4M8_9ACTN|nr:methyltransferase domain-containing protein [Acrocarpospora macrocephala]GES16104.1 protein-L-isoaspartate O-methyltransferase [Acrocarpospora macrocephala]